MSVEHERVRKEEWGGQESLQAVIEITYLRKRQEMTAESGRWSL